MKILTTQRSIWSLSFPIIIVGLSEAIVDITDAVFLGHYGITELAAIALADAIYELAIVAVVGLVDGIQIVVARRAGQDAPRAIGRVFNQGLYLLAIASVVLTAVIFFAAPHLTAWAISSGDIRSAVDAFLRIIAFSVFFHAVNLAYSALYVGISKAKVLIAATVILAGTNIGLDYCLIFGHFGFPEMGIEGAAIASLTAEIATFVYLTLYTFIRLDFRKFGLFAFGKWDGRVTRVLVSLSSPVALEGLVEGARWFLFFVIVEQLGEQLLAQAEIIYICYVVFLIPIEGYSEATCSMVSNLIGQNKSTRIGPLLRKAVSLSYLTSLPLAGLALIFPELFVSVFGADPETAAGCVAGLRVVALSLLVVVPGEIFVSALCGTGDTRANFAIELAGSVCIVAWSYAAALLFEYPLEYVWASVIIGWLVCGSLAYLRLRSGRWQRLAI